MSREQDNIHNPITFLTIVNIIGENKLLVIVACLVGLGMALLVNMVVPPTYESSVNMEVGKVWGSLLEAPQEICETILSESFLMKVINMNNLGISPKKLKDRVEAVPTKDVQKRVLSIVKVTVQGKSPEEAVQVLNSIVQLVEKYHSEMYKEWMKLNNQYQQELKYKIDNMKKEINELKTIQFNRLKLSPSPKTPVLHLEGYIEERETSYLDLLEEYHKTDSYNHSQYYSRKTRVRYPPPVPSKPVAPHKLLNSVAGIMIGFICAVAWGSYKKLAS